MSRAGEVKNRTLEIKDNRVLTNVKLVYGGIHGVVVSYNDIDDSRDINYKVSVKNMKFGAPASGDLVNAFDALKGDLLDICGYPLDGEDRTMLNNMVEVTGITYNENRGFVIVGELGVLDGKTINLVPPLVGSEGDYPGYGDIVEKVKKVYVETKEYLAGRKRLTNEQMIDQLERKNELKGFDKEQFLSLSPSEQLKMAIEIAEKGGCAVLVPDNVEQDLEAVDDVVNKYGKKESNPIQVSLVDVIAEEEETTSDDDDFAL